MLLRMYDQALLVQAAVFKFLVTYVNCELVQNNMVIAKKMFSKTIEKL